MNTIDDSNPACKIYEPTWIGLLQCKVISIKSIHELTNWVTSLKQANPDLPINVNYLLSQYEILAQQKEQLFKNVETEEARLILFKEHLSEKTMHFFPDYSDETGHENYISEFAGIIPLFKEWVEEWRHDGNYNIITLFISIGGHMSEFNDKTLSQIFNIIDVGLRDSHEIVQADIARGFLIDLAIRGEEEKYKKYMSENTFTFCKKINSIWQGEKVC